MKLVIFETIKIIFLSVLLSQNILCSHTEINISERFMKNKKSSYGKATNTVNSNLANKKNLLQSSNLNSNKSSNLNKDDVQNFNQNSNLLSGTNLAETAEKLANESNNAGDGNVIDLNIGNGPIYVTGWISFFKYVQTTETRKLGNDKTPRSFVPNGQYDEQFKLYPGFNKDEKSNDGLKYIPNNHSFYAILLKDSLNILTSRQVILRF